MKTLLNKAIAKENIMLVVIWGAVILTGLFALVGIVSSIEELMLFSTIHSIAVRCGLMYTVVHLIMKREWITTLLGTKYHRAITMMTALALHIALHKVSVHLAVAYTIFHLIQHRQDILSLFKRLAPSRNYSQNQAMQLARLA